MSITYYQVNLEELIPRLRQFFKDRHEILLAVVFGSAVRRRLVRDLDLAILFRGKLDLMDLCRLMTELEEDLAGRIFKLTLDVETITGLRLILESLKRIAEYAADIAEIVINLAIKPAC